jgi:hypothetical protein
MHPRDNLIEYVHKLARPERRHSSAIATVGHRLKPQAAVLNRVRVEHAGVDPAEQLQETTPLRHGPGA